MAIMFMWINYNYVYPVVDSNMKYCDDMHTKGYFSRDDIVAHYNCTIGLKVGPSECNFIQRKIINEEDKQYCFSYDDYNEDCEFDRAQYGSRCVWGGFGWMMFGVRIFLWVLTFTCLLMAFVNLFSKEAKEKNEIERYRASLQRIK
jgi:hypothetical protein